MTAVVDADHEVGADEPTLPSSGERPRSSGRDGPPLPGDYHVVRYGAAVAVCTLNSDHLAAGLAQAAPDGLAIVGTLHTENLGIQRIIRNIVANPNVRFLIVCGEDTGPAIGHLPGQSIASLFANGIDERGRVSSDICDHLPLYCVRLNPASKRRQLPRSPVSSPSP